MRLRFYQKQNNSLATSQAEIGKNDIFRLKWLASAITTHGNEMESKRIKGIFEFIVILLHCENAFEIAFENMPRITVYPS